VAYAGWQDAKYWVDQAAVLDIGAGETMATGLADPLQMQAVITAIENDFEDEVRGYVATPISASVSPELFERAKTVCAKRAAAELLKLRNQAQRDERMKWFDDWLLSSAQKTVDRMKTEATKATDAEVPTNPVLTAPTFVGLPKSYQANVVDAYGNPVANPYRTRW
jgi:hypothetical protein